MSRIGPVIGMPLKRPWILRYPLLSGALTGTAVALVGWGVAGAINAYRDRAPHLVSVCTSSHSEMMMLPTLIPDGNGGFSTIFQPTFNDVCDTGYTVCAQHDMQVDASLCGVI
jgi:hypothetical protein